MAHAGVAYALIQSQRLFWLACMILLLTKGATNYFSIHPTVYIIKNVSCGCLYAASLLKYHKQRPYLRHMLR